MPRLADRGGTPHRAAGDDDPVPRNCLTVAFAAEFEAPVSASLGQLHALLDDALEGALAGVNGDGNGEGPRG